MINEAVFVRELIGGSRSTGHVDRELMVVEWYTIVQHCEENHAEGEHSARLALHVTYTLSSQLSSVMPDFARHSR